MVRKGSPVRVRQRAFLEDPESAGSFCFSGLTPSLHRVSYRVRNSGPKQSVREHRGAAGGGVKGRSFDRESGGVVSLDHQLSFDTDRVNQADEPRFTADYLTIAEAARRVR